MSFSKPVMRSGCYGFGANWRMEPMIIDDLATPRTQLPLNHVVGWKSPEKSKRFLRLTLIEGEDSVFAGILRDTPYPTG
jgi:hypothetical protein